MNKKLQPLKNGSLATQVFTQLRAAIFSGDFQPGDPLREAHLARDLQVSQATVREALVKLEQMGLVVRTPNISTHVTNFTRQEMLERTELRAELEELACIRAARLLTEEDFARLSQMVKEMQRAFARKEFFEAASIDLEFHRYIWQQTGNKTLYSLLDQLAVPMFAFVSLTRQRQGDAPKGAARRHTQLIEALKTRREKDIKAVVRGHFDAFHSVPESLR